MTDTATQDTTRVSEFQPITLGPLKARISKLHASTWPESLTLSGLVNEAHELITLAVGWDLRLDAKNQREKATRVVMALPLAHPDGRAMGKGDRSALITEVRKQLNQRLRAEHREYERERKAQLREDERASKRRDAADERAMKRAEAKINRGARGVLLPTGSKPVDLQDRVSGNTNAVGGHIVTQRVDGQDHWHLFVTNGKTAALIELEVLPGTKIRECYVPTDALAAIQRAGAFRLTDKQIEPCDTEAVSESVYRPVLPGETPEYGRTGQKYAGRVTGVKLTPTGVSYTIHGKPRLTSRTIFRGGTQKTRDGGTRKIEPIVPKAAPASKTIVVTVSADDLRKVTQAAGSERGLVDLHVDTRLLTKGDDGRKRSLGLIRVYAGGAKEAKDGRPTTGSPGVIGTGRR